MQKKNLYGYDTQNSPLLKLRSKLIKARHNMSWDELAFSNEEIHLLFTANKEHELEEIRRQGCLYQTLCLASTFAASKDERDFVNGLLSKLDEECDLNEEEQMLVDYIKYIEINENLITQKTNNESDIWLPKNTFIVHCFKEKEPERFIQIAFPEVYNKQTLFICGTINKNAFINYIKTYSNVETTYKEIFKHDLVQALEDNGI